MPIVTGEMPDRAPERRARPVGDDPTPGSKRQDVARYVAELTGELATLARSTHLTFLAHLLEMAQIEAQDVSENETSTAAARPSLRL